MVQRLLPVALLLSGAVLAGCSAGRSNIDYSQVKSLPPLELPPNLVAPAKGGNENDLPVVGEGADYLSGFGSRVLPLGKGVQVLRDGEQRWLQVELDGEALWLRLREFWKAYGLALKVDSPTTAIMETEWQKGKVDGPRGWFGALSSIYDAGRRDKYRIRLEPLGAGRSELFLTHYGIQETVHDDGNDNMRTVWNPVPSESDRANELLNHLIVFLGNDEKSATAAIATAAQTTGSRSRIEGTQLIVDEGFERAWRRLGIALDRLGLVVEDRNRSLGIYYVSKVDRLADAGIEKGWFKSAFAKQPDSGAKYQLQVKGNTQSSTITLEGEGGTVIEGERLQRVLQQLQQAIN